MAKTWAPMTVAAAKKIGAKAKAGDIIRNPVCSQAARANGAKGHRVRNEAYRAADAVDVELAKRGLRTDHPHTCVWVVDRA